MPERAPYDEAMQLSQARLKIQDPDLKYGQVETISVPTVVGTMTRPWGMQGGFAVVYKYRTQSGKLRALRCFLVKMNPDTQFRYERLGSYFAAHAPAITAGFHYHDQGIIVKELVYGKQQSQIYPIIEMEWIEGLTLLEHVDELCRKRDRAGLQRLSQQWIELLRTLHQAQIAHGDLAGGNIMVRPDGRLVLVDYDGVYIPDFAGLLPVVLGQQDYQHPQMNQRPFNEQADNFSALVILTALLALQSQPELWERHVHRNAQGTLLDTNLLFLQQDFVDPQRSPLFATLEQSNDARVRTAVQALKQACGQAVGQVQFPLQLIDPDFEKQQALARLEQAIQSDDDEAIVQAWLPALLEHYGPAQPYLGRVQQAQRCLQALQRLRAALQTHSLQQILAAYDPILENYKGVSQQQAEQATLVLAFAQAYQADDDQAMFSAWQTLENSAHKGLLTLTAQEEQRIDLAQRRQPALFKFRLSLMNKSIQQIAASYDAALLDTCASITQRERDVLALAQDFVQAYQSDDDQGIVAASEAIQDFSYRTKFAFTLQEQQRIDLAQRRKAALVKFRLGLMSRNIEHMIGSYDWILDDCTSITSQERDLLRMAKGFMQAYYKDDDEAIASAWQAIQQSSYQKFFTLSAQQEQRIRMIQQRQGALEKFRRALSSKRVQRIVADYDVGLNTSRAITSEEREVLRLAQSFVQSYQSEDDQAIASTWEEIRAYYQQFFIFTEQEQQRIALAQRRKAALVKLRLAMMSKNIQQIAAAYDSQLDSCRNVTQEEQKQVALARHFVQAYQSGDDQAILAAWMMIQNSPYQKSFVFTPSEIQRITLAQSGGKRQRRSPHA